MKKLSFFASLVVLCLPLAASAQETVPKVEIFGGYSYLRADSGDTGIDDIGLHGFSASLAGNITKHIGIVGEFSRFTKSQSFSDPIIGQLTADLRATTYLFGPRVTFLRGKAEPFVHALFGGAHARAEIAGAPASDSGFAFALGGGLDVKVNDNFAIRVAQVDYLGDKTADELANNFRFSVGVVIRLGKR